MIDIFRTEETKALKERIATLERQQDNLQNAYVSVLMREEEKDDLIEDAWAALCYAGGENDVSKTFDPEWAEKAKEWCEAYMAYLRGDEYDCDIDS